MKIYRLKNALIYPAISQSVWDKSTKTILGVQSREHKNDPKEFGLMSHSKCHTDNTARIKYLNKNISTKLYGTHLYLGHLNDHFGHFMEECLGRIWACKRFEDRVDSFIFIKSREDLTLSPFILESLGLFDVDCKKLKLIDQFVEVQHLIVPELGSWFGGEKEWFKHTLKKYINIKDFKTPLHSKIIIRRSDQFLGRIAGFDYFSKVLVKNGFEEIYPENYTVREQIQFVVSAEFIIWEEGSACHLLKILPKLKSKAILFKRRSSELLIESLITRKFADPYVFNGVESLFDISRWFAFISRGNRIMARFNHPENALKFLIDRGAIKDYFFERKDFSRAERKDLSYFYINYFVLMGASIFIVSYIKPILPKFVWIKLKVIKDYFFGQR